MPKKGEILVPKSWVYDGVCTPKSSYVSICEYIDNCTSNTYPSGSPAYGLFAQTEDGPIITNTTAESSIIGNGAGGLSVPANHFKVGDSYMVKSGGKINTLNGFQTIRIRVEALNGSPILLIDSGVQNLRNVNNSPFVLELDFTVRQIGPAGTASIASEGKFLDKASFFGSLEGFVFDDVNSTTFDTTEPLTLDVTVEWGSANTSNTFFTENFVLTKIF